VAVGDPRGIGPEVVRKALRQPLDADVRIVGGWEDGRAPSELEAGRAAAQGIEAPPGWRSPVRSTPSSPDLSTSSPCTPPAIAFRSHGILAHIAATCRSR